MNKEISKLIFYFPVTLAKGERVFPYLREIKSVLKFNEEDLQEYQTSKMIALAHYVYESIPFYKKMFKDKGINCKDFKKLSDLQKFPIITKDEINKRYSEFVNTKEKKYWRSTSGTTGFPFKFQKDTLATSYMDAVMYTVYSWYGIDIGEKQGRIWGSAVESRNRIIQRTVDFFMNRKRLSTFNVNSYSCIRYEGILRDFKAKYLYGYVNGIYEFVETLKRAGKKWSTKLKCVIVTGEVLFDYQRHAIEEYFCTKVINEYGTTENGIIGFECENKKMHIMPIIHLEVVERDSNGDGEIVVTELNSRSIPFIRYKVGDIGKVIKGVCECGRSLPILELKKGRVDSYIRLSNGKLVYDAILAYVLKNYAIAFRGHQKEIDELTIEIVPKGYLTNEKRMQAEKKLREHLGSKIRIEFIIKEYIEKDKSGKLRYFVPMKT